MDGVKKSTGTEDLKGTQAYPFGFGAAHALAYKDLGLYPLDAPMVPAKPVDLTNDFADGLEHLAEHEEDV